MPASMSYEQAREMYKILTQIFPSDSVIPAVHKLESIIRERRQAILPLVFKAALPSSMRTKDSDSTVYAVYDLPSALMLLLQHEEVCSRSSLPDG